MHNLRKPIFWAAISFSVYWIIFLFIGMITMPISLKIVCGIAEIFSCYSFLKIIRGQVSDKPFVGVTFMIMGLMLSIGGKVLLERLAENAELLRYDDFMQWFSILPFLMIGLVLCGVLMFLFSAIGLFLKDNSKNATMESSRHLNL